VALGRSDAEAYRIAGFSGKHTNKRAAEIRANQGMDERIAAIRAATEAKFDISKGDAIRRCVQLADGMHGAEPHHRIAALAMIGKWCGWEKGTEAEQQAAKALGGVSDLLTRIRTRR
jgi:methyl coenzyme M reductase gamma subunit